MFTSKFVPLKYVDHVFQTDNSEKLIAFQFHHREEVDQYVLFRKEKVGKCFYWMLHITSLKMNEEQYIEKFVENKHSISLTFSECQTILAYLIEGELNNRNDVTRRTISKRNGV